MTPEVLLEIKNADGIWTPVGSISIDEPMGSISSEINGNREIFMFGWWQGKRGVYLSRAGIDSGNNTFREVKTTGLTLLSDLTEPYEMTYYREGRPRYVRFTGGTK